MTGLGTVLVVDDDDLLVASLTRGLRARQIEVVGAVSIEQALEQTLRYRPCAAVIDVYLGTRSGLMLADELRRTHPELPIVLFSAAPNAQTAIAALRYGVLIPKPVHVDDLVNAIVTLRERTPARCSLDRAEWNFIHAVLDACNGNVSATARWLKIPRKSLQRKLRRSPPAD